ncbi:MAG: Asp-tRNA(Asn)/Glu-tRNA(Gln) amidotransferase subunit GatA [Thermoflexales bacterium]|nr:Asp-tRNA(Asn)/Glu-tRNA(Gln) amidotransferase subunit GatA [Thermoflexales bacterium]
MIDLTLTEASAMLQAGQLSSLELTQALLDRILAADNDIQAFLTLTPELAMAGARAADERLARDERTPLLGVPIAVKDVLCVEGVPCTCGSRILEDFIPPYSATVVERLQALGAVILGKTNTDEFAMGSSTENSAYVCTHNPWDLERVPGGSSGGSAAAVAAGMALAALGTDTGGSVRQPASFCGVVGLKPSYGRVSRYGLVAFASSLDQAGVLSRSVADAAVMLGAIAGHDPRDSTSMPIPVPDYTQALKKADLRGLRVGVPKEYFIEGMQPEVEQAVRAAIELMRELGATVHTVSLPHTDYALPVYYLVAPAEASANLARYDGVRYGSHRQGADMWDSYHQTRGQGFGPEVKRRIMLGTYALSAGYYDAYYLKAQQVRTLIKGDFDRAWEQVDVIASPVSPTTAFKIGEKFGDPLQMYLSDVFTLSANLAGLCGLSVPCGFDQAGLPIGLQLMAPAFEEMRLLQAAYAYEQATEWHKHKPGQSKTTANE